MRDAALFKTAGLQLSNGRIVRLKDGIKNRISERMSDELCNDCNNGKPKELFNLFDMEKDKIVYCKYCGKRDYSETGVCYKHFHIIHGIDLKVSLFNN